MKFNVKQHDLQKAISQVEGIISSREIKSVISNILIEIDQDIMHLTTTDLEIGMKTSIAVSESAKGSITLPAKKLSQLIREFKTQTIKIESDDKNMVKISDASGGEKTLITIMGAGSDDYPTIPLPAEKNFISFESVILKEMIKKTSHAVAEEDARYVFNGLYMENTGKKTICVATDGRRLAKIEREFDNEFPLSDGIIIPNKAVRELNKLFEDREKAEIYLDKKENRIYFKCGDVMLASKLIEGQFPNYNQVIPEKLEYLVSMNKSHLENSIRKISIMAPEPSRPISFVFKPGTTEIVASTPDLGSGTDNIDSDYSGPEMSISFNSNYIFDIIRNIHTENVTIGFSSPGSQSVIKDEKDDDFIAVVMPMKL